MILCVLRARAFCMRACVYMQSFCAIVCARASCASARCVFLSFLLCVYIIFSFVCDVVCVLLARACCMRACVCVCVCVCRRVCRRVVRARASCTSDRCVRSRCTL